MRFEAGLERLKRRDRARCPETVTPAGFRSREDSDTAMTFQQRLELANEAPRMPQENPDECTGSGVEMQRGSGGIFVPREQVLRFLNFGWKVRSRRRGIRQY